MLFARRQAELALRRDMLRLRNEALRAELAERSTVLQLPLRLADGAYQTWCWIKVHPEVVVGTVVVVAVVRPRRAWALARWSWTGWNAWRRLRSLAAQMLAGYARAERRFESS